MADMHSGCVHRGLRYNVYLLGIHPKMEAVIRRRDKTYPCYTSIIPQRRWYRLYVRTPHEIVELAIAKVREYDAVVETYTPEEEEKAS